MGYGRIQPRDLMKFIIPSYPSSSTPSTTADSYFIANNFNWGFNASSTSQQQRVPVHMVLRNMYIYFWPGNPPGAGASWTTTVRKNGVDTAMTVTVAGTNNTGIYNGTPITFMPGDTIDIKVTPSTGTAPTGNTPFWTIYAETPGQNVQPMWATATGVISSELWLNPYGNAFSGSGHANVNMTMPTSGVFHQVSATLDTAPGSGKSWDITLCKNATDTSMTTQIANLATTNTDTTNQVRVEAGDTVSIHIKPNNTPANSRANFSVLFTPDIPGASVHNFITFVSAPTGATGYLTAFGAYTSSAPSYNTTDDTGYRRPTMPADTTITDFFLRAHTSPGSGKNYQVKLRKNSTDTAAVVTLADTNTTTNIRNINVPVAAGDYLNIAAIPSGTPTALIFAWGFTLLYRDSSSWNGLL